MAQDQDFYKKNKFRPLNNDCKWLVINNLQSLGIAQRNLDNALMIKPLSDKKWGEEMVDFMGPLF